MSSFLDLRPSSSSASSVDSAPSSPGRRPKTSSLTPTPPANDHNDIACRQLPPMSAAQTMPEPEIPLHRRHASRSSTQSPPKRFSVFGGRSRSNTATSASSSYQSPASSMTSMSSSHRSSQGSPHHAPVSLLPEKQQPQQQQQQHHHQQQQQQQGPPAERHRPKSVFSRSSRLLKRQGSKLGLSGSPTLAEEGEMEKQQAERLHNKEKPDGLAIFHRHRSHRSDTHELVKYSISEPFDFHHITHTNHGQLPPLDTTHPSDLATEFSILRASQRPRADLKGINAESIYHKDPPNEDRLSMLAPDSQSLFTRSPPTSPGGPRSPTSFFPPHSPPRPSRSVENFSRPVTRAEKPFLSPSIIPPPRTSSKFAGSPPTPEPACQNVDALLGPDHSYLLQPETKPPVSPLHFVPPDDHDAAGQACTTEDSIAKPLRSPFTHTPELADVPEEDESCWRNSAAPPASASPMNFSFPAGFNRSASRRARFNGSVASPASFLHVPTTGEEEDEAQSPTIPSPRSQPAQSPAPDATERNKEQSTAKRESVDESWEDDIDYCYEHAAESTSNFDWQRTSFEESEAREEGLAILTVHPSSPVAATAESGDEGQKSFDAGLSPPNANGSPQDTPDLQFQLPSSISSSAQPDSASPGKTECSSEPYATSLTSHSAKISDYLQAPASIQLLSPPFDESVSSNDTYDDLLSNATVQDPDSHLPLYTHSDNPSRSSRGSGSPISKYNSQESAMLSRAASIARKHRSSTSTTSVPELVHSSNCSRETVDRDRGHDRDHSAEHVRPLSPRAASHSRSKTLTKDAMTSGCGEAAPVPSTPTAAHDRAKSVSVLESAEPSSATTSKTAATGRISGTPRKTRTYSLFPTTAPTASGR